MATQTMLTEFSEDMIIFSGGQENLKNSDQYIGRCQGGGIHLHIYKLGDYRGCVGCRFKQSCLKTAHTAGEQAEP